jgi:hypothetical protein
MTRKDIVYKKRLLKLADFLDELPPKRFDFTQWVDEDWKGKPDLSCGTKACALGWATTIPSFRRLGMNLGHHIDVYGGVVNYVRLGGSRDLCDGPFKAAKKVFGLATYEEFEFLFVPDSACELGDREYYNSGGGAKPKTVAKDIRRFVAKKYAPRE